MRNLKFEISYCGSRFHGFQRQDNATSIQGELENVLSQIIGKDSHCAVNGCSRTDAGVHARHFCFNVHIQSEIDCKALAKGMNALLPFDIAVLSCEEVDMSFNARFDAKEKEYIYLSHNSEVRNPFLQNLAYHYRYPLDETRLAEVAQLFVGEHDFASYCSARSTVKSTVRTIYSFDVKRGQTGDNSVEFIIRGNGFLYNMVRILSGTLIYFSEGKRSAEDIKQSLLTDNRSLAGVTLPAHGLYLNRVIY